MFANIRSISFKASTSAYTKLGIMVSLLDLNKNELSKTEYMFKDIVLPDGQKVASNTYYDFIYKVDVEGIYFIKFEMIGGVTSSNEVRIDNLTINSGLYTYSSTFGSNEYNSSLNYTTEETLYAAINTTSLDWLMYNSTINYTNSYDNIDESDESNLCLRLRYNLDNTDNPAAGYAKLDYKFTNLKSISFDMLTTDNTYQLQIMIRNNGSIVRQIDFTTPISTENYVPEINHKEVNLDLTGGDYSISFHIRFTGNAANPNGVICIDNLVIQCS